MKISNVRITPVTIPVQAPVRYSTGADPAIHRIIVEVETDDGLVGLGECCGGAAREAQLRQSASAIVGEDPFCTELLRWRIGAPAEAKLFGNVNHTFAAIEFACLDIQGQAAGRPVSDLLGGRLREEVPLSGYLFYRYPDENGRGAIDDAESMVAFAQEIVAQYGFESLKLKAGVFPPRQEIAAIEALRAAFPDHQLRVDPNAAWSISTAVRLANRLRDCDLEYLEDPTWGLRGMSRVNQKCPWMPLASNMAVVTAEDLAPMEALGAVDVVLVDPHFGSGLRPTGHFAAALDLLNVDMALHSQGEFGVSMAVQLHLASVLPNLTHACDAHYHHLLDDIIVGGKIRHQRGNMRPPDGPGLGVKLDRDKMARYHELARAQQTQAETSMVGDPRTARHVPILPKW